MTACVREANGFDACVKTEDAGAQRTVARGLALLLSETLAPQGEFNGFATTHLTFPPGNPRPRFVRLVPPDRAGWRRKAPRRGERDAIRSTTSVGASAFRAGRREMASVDVVNVRKAYGGVEVIHGVSISIADGEFVTLVGPSGCGKSTLLRMIAGLESIGDGKIRIGKRVVNNLAPKDRDIAMVFQNYALYPHKTVAENMSFGL